MKINKKITKVNYNKGKNRSIKYIVIHYVGATGTAENNCKYFERFYRGASAHYFVGHSGDVWQCVEDKDIAWHCGAITYKHKTCRNANSIGIELCCRKGDKWYFEQETIDAATELVKELMKKYNIPASNVLRHYDITGKKCPEPFVRDIKAWENFRAQLTTTTTKLKTVEELAKEVIAGKWGNGTARKKALSAAGYDYKTVQSLVNKLLPKK